MAAAMLQSAKAANPFYRQRSAEQQSPSPEVSTSSTTDAPSRTFHRFRDALGQSIRTATKSKKQLSPPVDEFATIRQDTKAEKVSVLRRVVLRRQQQQETPVPIEPFISPSMRLASVSSPALHLSSQALPSPKSRPAVPASSSSTVDGLISPTRPRPRHSSPPQTQTDVFYPSPPSSPLSGSRHRHTQSAQPAISTPSTPQRRRALSPEGPTRARSVSVTPAEGGARSPSGKVRIVTPNGRGLTSASTSNLPLGSPSSPQSPRKTSDHRRTSLDTGLPRVDSPSPIRPRAVSPVQKSYSQNRHFNISSGSLILPSYNPENRELVRRATSLLCKEIIKPPAHMSRTESGMRDWEEVEIRMRSLVRLERIWQKTPVSPSAASSTSNVNIAGLSSSSGSISGEERERKLFSEALRDGFVLCQLMNKLRSANVVRPDAREDGFTRTSNITKFLAACASYGLPNDDLFQQDDLVEASSESVARVAKTIIALINFVESPAPSRLKYVPGQGKSASPVPINPLRTGSLSRASSSTPNLVISPSSPSMPSHSPTRKRYSPPTGLPPLRSHSPDEFGEDSSSPEPSRPIFNRAAATEDSSDDEDDMPSQSAAVKSPPTPVIVKPPQRPPLRRQPSNKQLDPGGLMSWAKNAASPHQQQQTQRVSVADSMRASVGDASVRDSIPDLAVFGNGNYGRQSMASTMLSEADTTTTFTAVSSILDGRNSSTNGMGSNGNQFGTIRTMTTDMTSEAPSISRAEGSMIAEDLAKRRSGDLNGAGGKTTRGRDAHIIDLSRVAEESESGSSKGHGSKLMSRNRSLQNKPLPPQPAIRLGKGKWPDDFIDAFQHRGSSPSGSGHSPLVQELLGDLQVDDEDMPSTSSIQRSTPPIISKSPPRKLAIVGTNGHSPARRPSINGQQPHPDSLQPDSPSSPPFPRRPTHRPWHSVDATPSPLLAKEATRRDLTPDGLSPTRMLVRRTTTKNSRGSGGSGSGSGGSSRPTLLPRGSHNLDSPRNSNSSMDSPVPFPRSTSMERNGVPTPSPRSSGLENGDKDRVTRPVLRGRFQSEEGSTRKSFRPSSYDDLGGGGGKARSRFESMVNLGGSPGQPSASDLLPKDGEDGSAVRKRVVVKEDGKPPVHYKLGNCIGRGQFGSVYRALNLNTGETAAVKRIRLEGLKEEEVMTLMKEVDLVKSLSHPSIVKYEGMSRDEESLNIVLEYVENGSLGQTIKAFGKLSERLVASYVVKILEGLHYLHTSQVVHCDLKAANILTTKNGNVKLSDFGVSLNLRAVALEVQDVAGTPNWMAPEVIELKGASVKSDIWSLGCTVIELLTGKPPYSEISNGLSVMFRIVEDEMPPLPEGCSDLLSDFLEQCFHKDPELRPDAETLCEHPWLKMNWMELKELRTQDSIPFLRRVSTDLQQRPDSRNLQFDGPELSASPSKRDGAPVGRRPSNVSIRPIDLENDIAPSDHNFIKTTFGKPVVCRVCSENIKKSAVLCQQCNLIAHPKCAANAPPTCGMRAHLLLLAHLAEKGNPGSTYSNPAVRLSDGSQNIAMSDIPFINHSPRTSVDVPVSAGSPSVSPRVATASNASDHPPPAFKFIAAFKRSRSNLHADSEAQASSSSLSSPPPVPSKQHDQRQGARGRADDTPSTPASPTPAQKLRKRPSVLHKPRHERPISAASISTGLSSVRSAATAAESFSSKQNTGLRSQLNGVGGGDVTVTQRRPVSESTVVRTEKEKSPLPEPPAQDMPGNLLGFGTKRARKNSVSGKKQQDSGCLVQ